MNRDDQGRWLTVVAATTVAVHTVAMLLLPWLSSKKVTKDSVEIYINGLSALGTVLAVIVALMASTSAQRQQAREARAKAQLLAVRHLAAVNKMLRALESLSNAASLGRTPDQVVIQLSAAFDTLPTDVFRAIPEVDVLAMTAELPDAGWNIGRSVGILLILQDEVRGIHRKNHIGPAMNYSATGNSPPERWRRAIDECAANLHKERLNMEALAKWHPGEMRFS